jgi:hypothetical protein
MSATAAAVILLWGYGLIGTADIFYYHFYRFQLHERSECFREHLLHTVNVLLMPLVVAGLYVCRTGGLVLWLATAAALFQVIILLSDVLEEQASRAPFGGLPRPEYFIHIVVCMMHAASLALILGERPSAAWSLRAPALLEHFAPDGWSWAAMILGAFAVPLGTVHIALAVRGYRSIQARHLELGAAVVGSVAAG